SKCEKFEIVAKEIEEKYEILANYIPYWTTGGGGFLLGQLSNAMTVQTILKKDEVNFTV
ncbi:hypothetical protein CCACVL1_23319, partial [Corchorus capsularis]